MEGGFVLGAHQQMKPVKQQKQDGITLQALEAKKPSDCDSLQIYIEDSLAYRTTTELSS